MFPGKGARRADAGLKISMTPDSAQRIFWEPSGQKILCRSLVRGGVIRN